MNKLITVGFVGLTVVSFTASVHADSVNGSPQAPHQATASGADEAQLQDLCKDVDLTDECKGLDDQLETCKRKSGAGKCGAEAMALMTCGVCLMERGMANLKD